MGNDPTYSRLTTWPITFLATTQMGNWGTIPEHDSQSVVCYQLHYLPLCRCASNYHHLACLCFECGIEPQPLLKNVRKRGFEPLENYYRQPSLVSKTSRLNRLAHFLIKPIFPLIQFRLSKNRQKLNHFQTPLELEHTARFELAIPGFCRTGALTSRPMCA